MSSEVTQVAGHEPRATSDARSWWVVFTLALMVAVVSGSVASSGEVPGWEQGVFHAVNDLPDWLERPMWVFQLAGLLLVPLMIAGVAAVRRRWRLAAALVALVPLKLAVEKGVVKQLVERQRPATSICGGPDELDPGCVELRGDVPLEGLSFVSGHAVIAWAIAAIAWSVLPRYWRAVPVVIAALNSIARVYLGAHNPLDVIGGGAVGVALGAVLVLLVDPPRDAPSRATTADHHDRRRPRTDRSDLR